MMAAKPWMKFYPSDWRADPALRMCSLAARGLWAELICLAHEAVPYGHVVVGGVIPTHKQLAVLCGCTEREIATLIAELTSAGVCSIAENGAVMSRRMVRDDEKVKQDKANGKLGGNPSLKGVVGKGVNPHDKTNAQDRIKPRGQRPDSPIQGSNVLSVDGRSKGVPGCLPGEDYDPPFDPETGEVA